MAERRRVLLKLSGELLAGDEGFGVDAKSLESIATRVRVGIENSGSQVAIVFGGGNYIRGGRLDAETRRWIDRVSGDQMGMLATVMNALAARSALEAAGVEARVMTAVPMHDLSEPFIRRKALRHLEKGRVLLLAGGTGHPYFTTDTTAALRALEIEATLLAKGTKVRGIYSDDPESNPDAEFFERISFTEVLEKRLEVMDAAAISLCRDQSLPLQVFDM
ncbi:MAG: UMP kinase, partial [Planctomycetota bacterium]